MLKVVVRFEAGVSDDVQSKALFDFEKALRIGTGDDIRVFKDRMADDSRLRVITDLRRKK